MPHYGGMAPASQVQGAWAVAASGLSKFQLKRGKLQLLLGTYVDPCRFPSGISRMPPGKIILIHRII